MAMSREPWVPSQPEIDLLGADIKVALLSDSKLLGGAGSPVPNLEVIQPEASTGLSVVSAWNDVRRKAKEIFRSGGVDIIVHEPDIIVANVTSTSGETYTSILKRQGPESQAISDWECDCRWGEIRNPANPAIDRQTAFLQGRSCAHVYATLLQVQQREVPGWSGIEAPDFME